MARTDQTGAGGVAKPRSAKGARTRQRLIDGATTVFERDGFLSARITDIATEAGTSHGSFYHYFDSKEEIFREVAAAQEVSLLRAHVPHDHPGDDPVERIRSGNRSYLEAYRDHAPIMRVIEEVSRYDTEVYRIRVERQHDFGQSLARSIQRLQAAGLADPTLDPLITATVLGGMVNKIAEMIFVQDYAPFDLDAVAEHVTSLWVSGLKLQT